MFLIDYVYYRVCKAYMGTSESSPEFVAAIIVSLIPLLNIMSIVFIIGIIEHYKLILSKPIVGVLFFLLLTINYIRYVYRETNGYKLLKEKYSNEAHHQVKGALVLLYILASFGLTLGLAIYLGNKRHPVLPTMFNVTPKS